MFRSFFFLARFLMIPDSLILSQTILRLVQADIHYFSLQAPHICPMWHAADVYVWFRSMGAPERRLCLGDH